jgi:arylsulfatase A-like enzyme
MRFEESVVTFGSCGRTKNLTSRHLLRICISLASWSCFALSGVFSPPASAQDVLPQPQPPFKGKIERTAKDSTPDFPKGVEAQKGAPNILLILTDDVGFGATSTFGGPIQTPNFQRLADSGLRYTTFHTTALCSPTRAALITGRNHHSVASGVITEMATGYPGYNSLVPKSAGSVGEVLRENGYNTSWFGKMHNVPDWMSSQAGPYDLWPSGLGFEYFYGFIGGDTDQWQPGNLYENTTPIMPYLGDPNFILDHAMADKAVTWMQMQHALAPSKPWLLYYATGTAHAPHHAPKEWIAKYKGQFDQGWDKIREETLARQKQLGIVPANTQLTKRPDQLAAWDSLSADQKRLFAHMMEVYAGALSYADNQIGRLLDAVQETGQLDNTLVIFIMGDNGASAEGSLQGTTNELGVNQGVPESIPYLLSMMDKLGGPLTYNHYPVGWAHAMDSPMQWTKQVASHFGGTRNGMVISWPGHIKDAGGIRSQFSSVIDIVPTIYEAAGITPPRVLDGVEQKPLEGTSLVYTFDNAKAPTRHTTQYFELVGNRAIYKDGWMASTTPLRLPWVTFGPEVNPDDFKWELYNINEDFSQANNLAAKNPAKLKQLQGAFDVEAKKYNVYPLDSSAAPRLDPAIRPSLTRGRTEFTYYPGMIHIPEGSAPNFKNTSWVVAAEVTIPDNGASGVLATIGGRFGGWALLMQDSKPEFAYALSNQPEHKFRIASDQPIAAGNHVVRFSFKYDGGGIGKGATGILFVDGKQVAQGPIHRTIPLRFSLDETFDVGEDTGTPVIEDYNDKMPFAFTGTLKKFVVILEPDNLTEEERKRLLAEEAKASMAVQ